MRDAEKLKEVELTKSRMSGGGRKPKHPHFDADLAKWVADSQASGRLLTPYIITEYAKDMAWARRIHDLKFSESWCEVSGSNTKSTIGEPSPKLGWTYCYGLPACIHYAGERTGKCRFEQFCRQMASYLKPRGGAGT
ncbi:hypothetical protein AAVH_25824 [Aphelenchoides avenae]|nr:hypothetical protein AAVH_25824 [Aphelenchus avenae]